jgi:hypothetical protein
MAYGTKYRIEWATPTADCRLRLQQDGYSSGVTDLEPATETFTLEWKRTDANEDLTIPLKISTGTIRLTGNPAGTQVKEVFDSGDTEWRVLFDRDTGGGSQLEWQGFVADDLYSDDPHRDSEAIELPVLDGLALLEDRDFDPSSANDLYTTLRNILRSLHDLPVAANMEWYPYRSGNQLSANQLPLGELDVGPQAFDELTVTRQGEFQTTDAQSKRRALEAVLERFGMELFQSRGEWTARQRHQIDSNREIKMWPDQSAVTNDNPTTRDLSRSLGALPPRDKPRGLVQRLRTAESVHRYKNLGNLIRNESFEDSLSDWTTGGSGTAARKKYSNTPIGGQTQNDTWVMEFGPSGGDAYVRQQIDAALHYGGPRSAYQFQFDIMLEGGTGSTFLAPKCQFKVKRSGQQDATLAFGSTAVNNLPNAKPADEGTLDVTPISFANGDPDEVLIPEGARLPIFESGSTPRGYIILSEPYYNDGERMVGEITHQVPHGAEVGYWYWNVGGSDHLTRARELPNFPTVDGNTPSKNLRPVPQKLVAAQRTPNGDPIVGDLVAELGADNHEFWVDHVSTQAVIGGDPVERTSYEVLDDQSGRSITLPQLLGDGPIPENPRALDLSGVETTGDWQRGAYSAGDPRSGNQLEEITAESAMRQQRDTLQRRTHEVELRGSEELWPQDVFKIDGNLYTVSRLKRTFGTAGDVAEVELTQLKDAGTSGLTRTFRMESEGEGGDVAAGGASGPVGGGGATTVLQNEVVGFSPSDSPSRFVVTDTSAPEPEIQSAIDYAKNNGGGTVVVGAAVADGGYDVSSVTFDSSVHMQVSNQAGEMLNVQAYGAAGNNSNDDYAAIQAALDFAAPFNDLPRTVYFPPGRYKITNPIVSKERVSVIGDQRNRAIIKKTTNNLGPNVVVDAQKGTDHDMNQNYIFAIQPPDNKAAKWGRVENLDFEGATGSSDPDPAFGVFIPSIHHYNFQNVLTRKTVDGFYMKQPFTNTFMNLNAKNITESCFRIGPPGGTSNSWIECHAQGGTIGFDFEDMTYSSLINCAAENLGGTPSGVKDPAQLTAWSSSTSFAVGDEVKNNRGEVYVCIQAHTSSSTNEPGSGTKWQSYWDLIEPGIGYDMKAMQGGTLTACGVEGTRGHALRVSGGTLTVEGMRSALMYGAKQTPMIEIRGQSETTIINPDFRNFDTEVGGTSPTTLRSNSKMTVVGAGSMPVLNNGARFQTRTGSRMARINADRIFRKGDSFDRTDRTYTLNNFATPGDIEQTLETKNGNLKNTNKVLATLIDNLKDAGILE